MDIQGQKDSAEKLPDSFTGYDSLWRADSEKERSRKIG